MSLLQSNSKVTTTSTGFYDFPIEQSLRFDGSSYLSRTPSTASNRTTWTWSSWGKRSGLNQLRQYLLGANDGAGNPEGGIALAVDESTENISFSVSGNTYNKIATSLLRDLSSWYHWVIVYDSSNGTAANRIRIYINGVEQTDYTNENSGLPPINHQTSYLNTTQNHTIGRLSGYNSYYFNGYLANIQFIDGQALDPYFFGEFKDNIWVPYNAFSTAGSGTATASDGDTATDSYGTNGFHLDFADSSNIGNDVSGNNNDWTVN